ncbi:hypothetical protein ASG33_08210 [Dyadobacter sp. Leaf189]|nr:hypothetical protein ASG33_08210 [Dyadobacter sp. Leaf189]
MAKLCKHPGCRNPVFSKLYCLFHQYLANKIKPIKKVSDKQAARLKVYYSLTPVFLGENKFCQAKLPGCTGKSTDVHHRRGRGFYLLEIATWMAVCRKCHKVIHDEMSLAEAIKRGLRIKRV